VSTFKSGPPKTPQRRRKRWPILVGTLLGALLPVAIEAGILGLEASHDVRRLCVGLLHADALHPPLKL
jgi:hypothetical protein